MQGLPSVCLTPDCATTPMKPKKHTLPRRPFTSEEDALLISILGTMQPVNPWAEIGLPANSWEFVAQRFTNRTARQCRERWVNYLAPHLRSEPWTQEEDQLLREKVAQFGRAWAEISRVFCGRSVNDVKNRWYTHLRPTNQPRQKRTRHPTDVKRNAIRLITQSRSIFGQIAPQHDLFDDKSTMDFRLVEGEDLEISLWE
jgi:hypothetical protein